MDAKGYMVFKDVTKWEEVEDTKAAAKRAVPAKSAGVKSDSAATSAPGAKSGGAAAQKKGAAKVQSALASFF